jgi:hypothetical protein
VTNTSLNLHNTWSLSGIKKEESRCIDESKYQLHK